MNTIRSTWLGWGVLSVAGAGSYYFAKRSINADKKSRFEVEQRRKREASQLEEQERAMRLAQSPPTPRQGHHKGNDHVGSPSGEASADPAPTTHTPGRDSSVPQSKYQAAEPYRSRKGDRFS